MARSAGQHMLAGCRICLLFAVALALASCVLRLAPEYDASLVEGLREANAEALQLFASAEAGDRSFSARRERYDNVIGRFDALKIEFGARPTPQTPIVAGAVGRADPTGGNPLNPTPDAIANIITLLKRMRSEDRRNSLSQTKLSIYKSLYTDHITTIFRNENILKRN